MRPYRAGVGLESDHWMYDVAHIILNPYWALFGNNHDFAEVLERGNATSKNATLEPSEGDAKAMTEIALPFVRAIYMLFGAFLLHNMIIALFSNTINCIEQDSQKIWKFSRVEMIYEFHGRTMVPPPFSMLTRLGFVVYWVAQRVSSVCDCSKGKRLFPISRHQIASKMTNLNMKKLLVDRHGKKDEEVERFLRLLQKYEHSHAEYVKICGEVCRNF